MIAFGPLPTIVKKVPMTDARIEMPPSASGYSQRPSCSAPKLIPSSITATAVTAYVSKRSAAMPAQSPTLSPTLSAITAGLRGSSSGMPASIFPTRSAPTSGLREDAAAEPREDGDQRAAEGEPDEIVHRRVGAVPDPPGEDPVVPGHTEEPQADDEQAGDR